MAIQKRYGGFILRRGQFWLFALAGVSAVSLTALITDPLWSILWLSSAVAVIVLSVVGRLRDLGCNAWLTPVALLPGSIAILGFFPGDEHRQNDFDVTDRVIRVAFSSLIVLTVVTSITGIPDLSIFAILPTDQIGRF